MIQTREECEKEGERFRGKKWEIKNREKLKKWYKQEKNERERERKI